MSSCTEVQVLENVWIPVDAETRLSARIWLPKSSTAKFSVVLEYIPYRKSDWTATRDASNHVWLAQRGFAVARVDIRGSGNSEGHFYGEYTPQELQDGVMVIEWLASQSWCSGSVGVFGKSWGGFNGLQLAAMAPPALRGVVSLYSIDDRYADDVHYMGGAVLGSEALSWATVMFSLNALPMAPETVGSEVAWKRRYQERLEKQFPWLHEWLAHQTRDEFWEHGSICETYDKVKCPVLEIGGWNDGYFNGVARMIKGMKNSPSKGVWWEYSLNDKTDNSATRFPDLQLFVKDEIENPTARILEYPGKWCGVDDVEKLEQKFVTFYCSSGDGYKLQTTAEPPSTRERVIAFNSLQGAWSGEWLSFGGEDMPGNQLNEDAIATTWTTGPLNEDIEIIGRPQISVFVKSSKPQALIMARLSDVSPSGKSTLITRGVLNLRHRHGHKLDELSHMPIGENTRVTWQLNACAYTLRASHTLVLSVTPSYWPMVWPSPEPVELSVSFAESNLLKLPVLPEGPTPVENAASCPVKDYPLDAGAPSRTISLREAPPLERNLTLLLSETDSSQPLQRLVVNEDQGKDLLVDEGIVMEETAIKTYTTDPQCLHPRVSIQRTLTYEKLTSSEHSELLDKFADQMTAATHVNDLKLERVDYAEHPVLPWKVRVETDSSMASDETTFFLKDHMIVRLNEEVFFEKTWEKEIPRQFV
ncbi:X-Pro dipeptidyl-peptidase C-terminal non-catalytic domain [Phytophthora infestans]|uniref:X-Pro dipeptidyl-peptidase C-terminal non-catalytic domain n=1 Tax=Phytophthora infestans TaxID=4787 RepID=A0A8S9UGT3_PHYIN|nr:X-Pro dipeptidyl-peptidase C-terminal non-catalytic domain [Phytophthora infestans]